MRTFLFNIHPFGVSFEMMLRMQQRLCEHLGVEVENIREHADQMIEETDVRRIVSTLEEKLPE